MDFEDFKREFTDLEICHSSIDALDEDENITSWNLSLFSGGWSKQKVCENLVFYCTLTIKTRLMYVCMYIYIYIYIYIHYPLISFPHIPLNKDPIIEPKTSSMTPPLPQ